MSDIEFQTDYVNYIEQLTLELDLNKREKEYLWEVAYGLNYITFIHSLGVAELAALIGEEYGITKSELKRLKRSAFFHDIGKMQIDSDLLFKKNITSEDFKQLKKHVLYAEEYLIGSSFEECIPEISAHHENWDGSGYAGGLKGEEIPLNARIIRVADSFNSATTDHGFNGDRIKTMKNMLLELDIMRHNKKFIFEHEPEILVDRKIWYDGDVVDAFMLALTKREKTL